MVHALMLKETKLGNGLTFRGHFLLILKLKLLKRLILLHQRVSI